MANEQHHPDGWLQDGSLLYRLTDDAHPVNRDEINVAMADGSRSVESCTRRAGELLDCIRAGQAALFAAADASELPKVPDSVLCYVHAYGDSRADDDGRSGLRIGELILALRRWAKSIAAPTIQAAPAAVAGPSLEQLLRDARHRIANLSRASVPFDDPLDGPVLKAPDAAIAAAPTTKPEQVAQGDAPGRWLVVNIGCIECGVSTALVGRFDSKELAQAVANECAREHAWREGGQNNFEVFNLDAACSSEYAEAIARAAKEGGEA